MDNNQKERIKRIFIEIARDAKAFLSTLESARFSDTLLVSSYAEESETILDYLLKDRTYFLKFSEEYIEKLLCKKIGELILRLRQEESGRFQRKARDTAEQLFDELDNYTEKQTVYLPVSGINIQLEGGQFEIGNITFQKMTQERIDEVISAYSSVILATKHTVEEKENLIRSFTQRLQKVFTETENAVCAVYQVVSEPMRAEERARDECYQVFDLLRYALPALYPTLYPMQFSIPIEEVENTTEKLKKRAKREKRAKRDAHHYLSFGLQGEADIDIIRDAIGFSDRSFHWNSERRGNVFSFEITQEHITSMAEIGVFDVTKILKGEEPRTKFKETLLRSIHWFASAQTPMQSEYVVLSLFSSLEAFLNPPSHEQVTEAVVEGAAILGGKGVYKYARKRIGELYEIRSLLSHGDEALVVEKNIFELRQVAFYVIQYMIQRRNDFINQKECFEAIKKMREEWKQKYGCIS